MTAHGEAVGSRIESFDFICQDSIRSPPPRPMHKGNVGRIHQADYSVIDKAGKGHRQCRLISRTFKSRDYWHFMCWFALPPFLFGHINPDISLDFPDWIPANLKLTQIQILTLIQSWNQRTLTRSIKSPAVVGALNFCTIKPSATQGDSAMGTDISQCKYFAAVSASKHNWFAK